MIAPRSAEEDLVAPLAPQRRVLNVARTLFPSRRHPVDDLGRAERTEASPIAELPARARGEIMPLQYGRGIAALLVVLFHADGMTLDYLGEYGFAGAFRAGHSGVEFFFLLSGFIIYNVHRTDIGAPKVGNYLMKRAIRVLPMFWMTIIPLGLVMLLIPSLGADRELTVPLFLADDLLIPRNGVLTFPPAWTLQHEVIFYLVFATIILAPRWGVVLFAVWQAACLVALLFGLIPQDYLLPISKLFGFYNFGFLFGLAIGIAYHRFDFQSMRPLLVGGGLLALIGLVICFAGERSSGTDFFPSPAIATLIYFALYGALLVAFLSMPRQGNLVLNTTLGALGAASYALYLMHEPVISVLTKIFGAFSFDGLLGSTGFSLAEVTVAVIAAVIVSAIIERPVTRALRRRFIR